MGLGLVLPGLTHNMRTLGGGLAVSGGGAGYAEFVQDARLPFNRGFLEYGDDATVGPTAQGWRVDAVAACGFTQDDGCVAALHRWECTTSAETGLTAVTTRAYRCGTGMRRVVDALPSALQPAGEALQNVATSHATEARKDLISAYCVTAAKGLGVRWAAGMLAGIAIMSEIARRDPEMAVAIGDLVDELHQAHSAAMTRDDLEAIATDFIRAWDIAG